MPRDYDRRTDCLNAVYREAAAARPDVARVLPVDEWVCPPADRPECIGVLDGVNLREDGVHFEGEGADVAARWIVEQLYGPPTP
jgi:lysophospholipase L1-like esterase